MNITKKVIGSGVVLGVAGMMLSGAVVLANGEGIKTLSQNNRPSNMAQNRAVTPAPAKMETRFNTAKADNLRVLLNSLHAEHMNLASNVLRNGYEGTSGFTESYEALDNNSQDIAASVGAVYGADAQAAFLPVWRSHIEFFRDYTVAMKQGDQAGMAQAERNLAGYVDQTATFFSKANPNLPYDAVHQVVTEHVALLKSVIDEQANQNYTASYSNQRAGDKQIREKVADTVAGAIVKQFPNKFNSSNK